MRLRETVISAVSLSVAIASLVVRSPDGDEAPTWSADVAPLVHSRCTVCHNKNGHGPFALESYRDVSRRWELVRQDVLNLLMPPCGFSSDFGAFCLSEGLNDEQRLMLQKWIQAGMPKGGDEPAAPAFPVGFRLGKPDIVVKPKVDPVIPVEGNNMWRAVVLQPAATTTMHINGFDVVPHTPKAVRHVLLAVASDAVKEDTWETVATLDEAADRMIGQWAPGYPAFKLPAGTSLVVRPGERLIALVQYSTLGRKIDSGIDVGLYFGRSGDREATWSTMELKDFELEPYQETRMTTTKEIQADCDLLAVLPEARFFAYVIDIQLQQPGERSNSLLRTERWNAYWNGSFVYREPIALKQGAVITSHFVFENEAHSLINEGNRPRLVFSGKAFDQEVCRTHILTAPRSDR